MAILNHEDLDGAADGRMEKQSPYEHNHPKVRKLLRRFLKLFIIIPVILFVVTVILGANSAIKLKTYHKCTGTIVGFYETASPGNSDSDAHKDISPVISYTVDGKDYEFVGNYYSTSMKVGQEISIVYPIENPADATIQEGLYFAPAVLGGLTLIFASFYIVFVILKRKGHIQF